MEKPASGQYDGDGFDKDSIRSFSPEERKSIRSELNKEIARRRTRSWTLAFGIFIVFTIAVIIMYRETFA